MPASPYTNILNLWMLVFVLIVFLSGYFPVNHGDTSRSTSDNLPSSWRRKVGHLVIMVIDALRADFVLDLDNETKNPRPKIKYLQQLLEDKKAIGFVAKANPPTVTLPRIKVEYSENHQIVNIIYRR